MNSNVTENTYKEIDLIQACITRMAHNSFLLKAWTVSIIAVVVALSKEEVSPLLLAMIVTIPLVGFWYLDAFFLYTERLYRKMYQYVIGEVDFTLENDRKAFSLNTKPFEKHLTHNLFKDSIKFKQRVFTVMFSKTLLPFYGLLILLTIIISSFLHINNDSKTDEPKKIEIINTVKTTPETISIAMDSIPIRVDITNNCTKKAKATKTKVTQ